MRQAIIESQPLWERYEIQTNSHHAHWAAANQAFGFHTDAWIFHLFILFDA